MPYLLLVILKANVLKEWIQYRSSYLDELLRLDGHDGLACSRCGAIEAIIRCTECHSLPLFCETCAVDVHALNPLHRVEVSDPVSRFLVLAADELTEVGGWVLVKVEPPSARYDCAAWTSCTRQMSQSIDVKLAYSASCERLSCRKCSVLQLQAFPAAFSQALPVVPSGLVSGYS